MNDAILCQDFSAVFSAVTGFPAAFTAGIVADPTSALFTAPTLRISGVHVPYGISRLGTVKLAIFSNPGDEDTAGAITHDQRFELLWNTLFQVASGRVIKNPAFFDAANALGRVLLADYGLSPDDTLDAGVDSNLLRTTLNLRVAWRFVLTP